MGGKILDHDFWNRYFEVYDVLNKLIPYSSTLNMFLEFIPRDGAKVLDLGCGTGNLMKLILSKAKISYMVGLDFSDYAVEYSKKKLNEFKNVKIFKHNLAKSLPFPNEEFDYIVMNNVLYTLEESVRAKLSLEIHRILKRTGRIAMSSINNCFSPAQIYLEHTKISIKNFGLLKTVTELIKYVVPTIKIFYFNAIIKHQNKDGKYKFIRQGEQQRLLKKAGLKILVGDRVAYAGSAYFSVAEK